MGVQGLMKLVNTSNILEDFTLTNSHIIIDAANTYYSLYFNSDPKLDQSHGGDYSGFRDEVCRFLQALQNCKVTAHVVLDGGSGQEKLETLVSRLQSKLEKAKEMAEGETDNSILPPLVKDVFKQILIDKEIEFEESFGEADLRVASWANDLVCPVLSNDSDFYIYDLKAGVLPLNQFKWKNNRNGQIEAKLYRRSKFCSCFFIDPALVPVFASIAGNDYSKLEDRGKFTQNSPRKSPQDRLRAILRFLERLDLQHVQGPEDKQKRALRGALNHFGEGQTNDRSFLESIKAYEEHPETPETRGDDLPEWMREKLKKGRLTSFVTDVLRYRRMMLTPLVDDFSQPSSYTAALRIRQFFYGLLGQRTCTEFDRTNNSVSTNEVSALLPSVSQDDLQQLHQQHLDQAPETLRAQVLMEALECQGLALENVPDNMKLQVCVTNFWWRRRQEMHSQAPNIRYLDALLLGFVYGEHLDPGGAFEKKMEALKVEGGRIQLQPDVAHAFSQWQSCFRQSLHLNQLLCFPLPEPECSRLYCGPVLHQLAGPGPENRPDTVKGLMNEDQRRLFDTLEAVCRSLEHNKFWQELRRRNQKSKMEPESKTKKQKTS